MGSASTLFDDLKRIYQFDVSHYAMPWRQILKPYVAEVMATQKAPLWNPTLLLNALSQYKDNEVEGADKSQDGVAELMTTMMIHHLAHETDPNIHLGVFELLPRLTLNGSINIHSTYWSRLAPALINYMGHKVPAMNPTNQANIFERIYYVPQVWPHITDNIWKYIVTLQQSNDRYHSGIALRLLTGSAPAKYTTIPMLNEGMTHLLRSYDDNALISSEQLRIKMTQYARPLLMWSNWLELSLSDADDNIKQLRQHGIAKVQHSHEALYEDALWLLVDKTYDGNDIDTWRMWLHVEDAKVKHATLNIHEVATLLQLKNEHLHKHYLKYASVAEGMYGDTPEKQQCLLDFYKTPQPTQHPQVDTTLFETP